MNNGLLYVPKSDESAAAPQQPVGKGNQLMRLIRAAQPISRAQIAERLNIDRSTVTENVKPLVTSGLLIEESAPSEANTRRTRLLSFAGDDYFIGVNLGVRHSQVGITTLRGEIEGEVEFETPSMPKAAIRQTRALIEAAVRNNRGRTLRTIGISVPGMIDPARRKLVFAPNLNWNDVDLAS